VKSHFERQLCGINLKIVDRLFLADSVEKLRSEKLSSVDAPKLAATVAFRRIERTNQPEIELSRALLSEISTSLSETGVFQQNRSTTALADSN
jgi:hypothetical protein